MFADRLVTTQSSCLQEYCCIRICIGRYYTYRVADPDPNGGKAHMAETVEELTIQYEEDGQVLRKELDKEVLSKGSWATIMFLYQDLDRKSGDYGPQKISIRRFQKREGTYLQRSKFEISSANQARSVCRTIGEWLPAEES